MEIHREIMNICCKHVGYIDLNSYSQETTYILVRELVSTCIKWETHSAMRLASNSSIESNHMYIWCTH